MASDLIPTPPGTPPAEVPDQEQKHFLKAGQWFLGALAVLATVMSLVQPLSGAIMPLLEAYRIFAFCTVTCILTVGILSGLWMFSALFEIGRQLAALKKRNEQAEQMKITMRHQGDVAETAARQQMERAKVEVQQYLAIQRSFERIVVPDVAASQHGKEVKVHLYVTNEGPDLLTITDASFRLASAGTGIPGERMRFKMENNVQIAPCLRGLVGHVTLSGGAVRFRLDEVQITGGLPDRDTKPRSTSRDVLSVHWFTPEPSDAETSSTPESSTSRP